MRKPLFGIIAQSGGTYSVEYVPEKTKLGNYNTSSITGYSLETITKHKGNFPVIDFSNCDLSIMMGFTFNNNFPHTEAELQEYIDKCRKIGAIVTDKINLECYT